MRDFLMELYLLHGEREFFGIISFDDIISFDGNSFSKARNEGYISFNSSQNPPYKLTPKALALIKNDS